MYFPVSNVLGGLKRVPVKTIVSTLIALSPFLAMAQNVETSARLLENLATYNAHKPLEKVHLHLNKNVYAAQDSIWFQSYLVDAKNKPAKTSKILYVELIDAQDSIRKAIEVPLKSGFGGGNFLPLDSLKPGKYQVRAYTNLMKNFGSAYFFNQDIVLSGGNVFLNEAKNSGQPLLLRFFPEGGNLVSGIKSKVVVQLLNASDPTENYAASLRDNEKNEVLKFNIPATGIASFTFRPEKGKTYVAVIQPKGGTEMAHYLPQAVDKGYTISADNTDPDSLRIELNASREFVNGREIIFIPFSGNRPLFSFHTKFPDTKVALNFPKNKLADGIIKLIVFDASGHPLTQTQVFLEPKQLVSLTAEGLDAKLKAGSVADLNFKASNPEGKPVSGNFSLSVDRLTDAASAETGILKNLLLSPDLHNVLIAENGTQLSKTNPEQAAFLNNLLLASDTEKLPWAEINGGQLPDNKYLAEDSVFVSGTVRRPNKEPKTGAIVTLTPVGSTGTSHLLQTTSDANGHFKLAIPEYFIQEKYTLKAKSESILYRISLDENTPYPVKMDTLYTAKLNEVKPMVVQQVSLVADTAKVIQPPKTVEVPATNSKLPGSNSRNLNGPGNADKILTAKEIQGCPSADCLAAFLPGVYGKNGNLYQVPDSGMKSKGAMRVLIDGQVSTLSEVLPKNVETIEFLKSPALIAAYGSRGIPGVLVVTTKNSTPLQTDTVKTTLAEKTEAAPRAAVVKADPPKKIIPYTLPFQISSVNLETGEVSKASQFKPSKNTVFWTSNLKPDANGKFSTHYLNSDVPGKYKVTVEGISSTGEICSKVFFYEVY